MDQVTFRSISVLALESLLFPADQLITMEQGLVPGDLLVVGGFLTAVRKTAPNYNVTISAASGARGEFAGTSFENGKGTGSVTVTNLTKSFVFKYGPIRPELGGLTDYTVDIAAGTVSPGNILLVVDQPDPDNHPQQVILLPPGYGPAVLGCEVAGSTAGRGFARSAGAWRAWRRCDDAQRSAAIAVLRQVRAGGA
jgi:hypothetical protein